ncbi:MAG: DUF2851 family protein [Dehalococcoidia bacterium]|nr:DUF2851 family protein [Dehalococcoidia bacterium]
MRYNPVMRGIDSVTGVRERRLRGTRYSNGDARLSVGSTIRDRAVHYAAHVSEPQGAWPSEKDLCDAWESGAGHRRGQRLRTVTGSTVDVIQAGIRNSGDGPDFLGAAIVIESPGQTRRVIRGDVEMHLRATDWFAHGHETNPAFASVVLHVVEDAQEMVEIAGAPVLEVGHSTRRLNHKTTATMPKLLDLGAGEARDAAMMLDALGDARLEERAAAMEGDIAVVGPEQALYEALLRGLGYTRNMTAFQEVARLMPIDTLWGLTDGAPNDEARLARLTGLLFGAARLLPSQRNRKAQGRFPFGELTWSAFDSFTASSETEWARYPGLESLPRGSWQTFRVRPDNHPVRRMGAAVELMLQWFQGPGLLSDLYAAVSDTEDPRDAARLLIGSLVIPPTGYWATHSDFGKLRRSRPSALIGRGRALDMIATAVLPFLLAMSDLQSDVNLEQKTRQIYAVLPNPGESKASRRARHLLGGHSQRLSARRYQGFLNLTATSLNGSRESLLLPAE